MTIGVNRGTPSDDGLERDAFDAMWASGDMGTDTHDEEAAAGPKPAQRSRDESLAFFLEQEPTLLGEPLMVVGRSVLTAEGDVVDVLAVDERGAAQVITVSYGIASAETLGCVIGQGAWVDELDDAAIREIFAAQHPDATFDEAFEAQFGEEAPDLNGAQVLTVVAAGLDEAAERGARYLSEQDIEFRAFAFQEFVDEDDTYIMTSQLV